MNIQQNLPMKEHILQLGVAQVTVSDKISENLDTAKTYISKAAECGCDLLVFPEMFMAKPTKKRRAADHAEPLDGPFISALSKLARRFNISVICGVWLSNPQDCGKAINVAIAIDKTGQLETSYNKLHLCDALNLRESETMTGGDKEPPLFSLAGFKVGIAICYDLRFPELFRNLTLRGAELIVVPSAWYNGELKREHWLTLLRARSIENTIYIAGINICSAPFSARSSIFDPFGVQLADAGEGEGLITAKLSTSRLREVRASLPCLQHMRRDVL